MKDPGTMEIFAFAPAHITGFFQIFANGSTGAGLNTTSGAVTRVRFAAQDSISINEAPSEAAVSRAVFSAFDEYRQGDQGICVEHSIAFPIGYGMGMSGAGAFSLSLALNELLGAKLEYEQCMQIARDSEIACGTGLGDVVAQQFPGVMMGLPPYPSTEVQLIEGSQRYVACAFFEALSTESIIRNPEWVERINAVGAECMQELGRECTRLRFMELSRHFSLETNLASEQVQAVMKKIPGSSMAMLGQTVFLLCDSPGEGLAELEPFATHCMVSEIATKGACVLDG